MTTVNFTQPNSKTWRSGYLEFRDLGKIENGVTHKWEVVAYAEKGVLGWVEWKSGWRRYTFKPITGCYNWYDFSCLTVIAEFVRIRTDERKAHWGTQGRFANC